MVNKMQGEERKVLETLLEIQWRHYIGVEWDSNAYLNSASFRLKRKLPNIFKSSLITTENRITVHQSVHHKSTTSHGNQTVNTILGYFDDEWHISDVWVVLYDGKFLLLSIHYII